jgi:uncharacterized protein YciI
MSPSDKKLFAVMLARGAAYQHGQPLEQQVEWDSHAKFMDDLVDEGVVMLGGPLEGTNEVLLIFRAQSEAEIRQRLAADPWHRMGLLEVSRVMPWTLRLGKLPDGRET